MSCKSLWRGGIAGLILGLASVVGCGGEPPPTDGEEIPARSGHPPGVLKQGAGGKKGPAKSEALKRPRLRRRSHGKTGKLGSTQKTPQE